MRHSAFRRWAGAAAALWLAGAVASCGPAPDQSAAGGAGGLIARADLFGDPIRSGGQLSPRGDRVAFLAPRDGVTNLWVLPVDAMDEARALTDDRTRGVRRFAWAHDNATLLFLKDEQGDENWRLYAVNADGGAPRALTPPGARAEIVGLSANDPNGVVVSLNQRDPDWPDLFRIDLGSGRRTLVHRNAGAGAFASFVLDRDNALRLGLRPADDGGAEVFARGPQGNWARLFSIPFEDAMSAAPIAFAADGRSFLMLDTAMRERAALVRVDAATGEKTEVWESARADVVDVWFDPATNAPEAYATEYLRREWSAIDTEAQADLDFLDQQLSGDFSVVSRSADDARWIVLEEGPTTPPRSHLYDRTDRAGRRLTLLFRQRPALETAALQPMIPVEIEARDGLTLVSYLTLPAGADANGDARPDRPAPLVLLPHDGPWARDSYGFNAWHQWLANRGYAALSVNFRGSTGFSKAFLNAGNGALGAGVQDDLADAVDWAVANGVAAPGRIAILGAGYGGYSAVSALANAPERFRCAASYGARASLGRWVEQAPASLRPGLYRRVGDPRTEQGRRTLRERAPLSRIGQIRNPLLLAIGLQDRSASRAEADQLAQAVRARGQLTYLVFPNEGRELVRPQNRLSYLSVVEHFLGDCLGGRVEPVGASFEGADIQVYDGAVNVPGLSAFSRRLAQSAPGAVESGNPKQSFAPPASDPPSFDAMSAEAP